MRLSLLLLLISCFGDGFYCRLGRIVSILLREDVVQVVVRNYDIQWAGA